MKLILKRLLSSSINGFVIFLILLIISLITAEFLWFFPLSSSIDMKYIYLFFSLIYSIGGALNLLKLAKLGSSITGIKLIVVNKLNKKLSIVIRISLFYLIPVTIYLLWKFISNTINDDGNRTVIMMLLFPSLFIAIFTIILIPLSVIIGRGYRGIHDYYSGVIVLNKGQTLPSNFQLKDSNLVFKSLIINVFVSFVITLILFKTYLFFTGPELIYKIADSNNTKGQYFEDIKYIDSVIGRDYLENRSYYLFGDLRWWIDLYGDDSKKIKHNKSIGLHDSIIFDLLGYGIKLHKLDFDIKLTEMENRIMNTSLYKGTPILSVYFFVDTGIFYFDEMKYSLVNKFKWDFMRIANHYDINTINYNIVRIIRVGLVSIGFKDSIYTTTLIRDESTAFLADNNN